jgi:hypothetical protein
MAEVKKSEDSSRTHLLSRAIKNELQKKKVGHNQNIYFIYVMLIFLFFFSAVKVLYVCLAPTAVY